MNFICQIIEFQLFGHIFCCFSVFETFNWSCREIWYEHLYFDLFGSCQTLRINYQLTRESKPENEPSPDDSNRHKQETQNKSFQILDPVP